MFVLNHTVNQQFTLNSKTNKKYASPLTKTIPRYTSTNFRDVKIAIVQLACHF